MYASLGLRHGGLAAEQDLSIAPTPRDASYQLFIARLLSTIRYGTVLGNEDRDLPPLLPELLRASAPAFDALGFEVGLIASRVNIYSGLQ